MTIPEQLPCPCAPDQLLRVDELVAWAKDHNDNQEAVSGGLDSGQWTNGGPSDNSLPCGRYYVEGINQESGNFSLNAEGRLVLFVDGDFRTGSLNITTSPGAEIDLFISGDLIIEASADFGSPENPSSVRTYVWGQVTLQASAGFAGNIYAPNADIDFGASANIYGSVFAKNVIFSGNSSVHYDSNIRTVGDECPGDDPGEGGGGGSGGDPEGGNGGGNTGSGADGGTVGGGDTTGADGGSGSGGGGDGEGGNGGTNNGGTNGADGGSLGGGDTNPIDGGSGGSGGGGGNSSDGGSLGGGDTNPIDAGSSGGGGGDTGGGGGDTGGGGGDTGGGGGDTGQCTDRCSNECGDQACISGQCAPCQTDLDCCAPFLCVAATGQCILVDG
jgi:hypothetical protein